MSDKTLFKNDWINVVERDGWYTMYEAGTNEGVTILILDSNNNVLVRYENCPPHGGMGPTSFTGMVEKGETPLQTAIKELREESGYIAKPEDLLPLGYYYPSKMSALKMHCFSFNASGQIPQPLQGDGTKGEEGSFTKWWPLDKALQEIPQASFCFCLLRLGLLPG